MKFANMLVQAGTLLAAGSAASINLGAAVAPYRALVDFLAATASDPNALKAGGTAYFKTTDTAGNWEIGLFTVTSSGRLDRMSVDDGSNGTNPTVFSGTAVTVTNDVPASYLTGQSLPDYLAANPGSAVGASDLVLMVQNGSVVGESAGGLAAFANSKWPSAAAVTNTVITTAAITLDVSTHQRKRIFCTATPASVSGPAVYGSVGDGFECEFVNVSGAPIPLANMTVLPSGASIPNNSSCRFKSGGGVLYADLGNAAAAAGGTVPAQVTGLTAGAATSTTQPLSWTAVTGATGYKVEYTTHGGTSWTTASANVAGTSYTVPGLTANQSYDYRVSAIGTGGAGTPSAVVTASTAAAGGGGSGVAPFKATSSGTGFPTKLASGQADPGFLWCLVDQASPGSGPTVTKVQGALSLSNTTKPTTALNQTSTPEGNWIGNLDNYNGGHNWIVLGSAASAPNDGSGTGFGGINWNETARDYYYWLIVTDSAGAVWYFVSPQPINIGSPNTGTPPTAGVQLTFSQVQ